MSESYGYQALQARHGPRGPWMVRLLLATDRMPDREAFLAARRRSGRVEAMADEGLSIALLDATSEVEGRQVPALHMIMPEPSIDRSTWGTAVGQTWTWPDVSGALARVRTTVVVAEMVAHGVAAPARLGAMVATVRALVAQTDAVGVHWLPSDRLVPANVLRRELQLQEALLGAAVNVRMFRVEGDDAMVMDTLGMAAFGLPDLQCRFEGLEPNEVAAKLYDIAAYLFEYGDVLAEGHTVEGVYGVPWRCQRGHALVVPDRLVVDLDRVGRWGGPTAAG